MFKWKFIAAAFLLTTPLMAKNHYLVSCKEKEYCFTEVQNLEQEEIHYSHLNIGSQKLDAKAYQLKARENLKTKMESSTNIQLIKSSTHNVNSFRVDQYDGENWLRSNNIINYPQNRHFFNSSDLREIQIINSNSESLAVSYYVLDGKQNIISKTVIFIAPFSTESFQASENSEFHYLESQNSFTAYFLNANEWQKGNFGEAIEFHPDENAKYYLVADSMAPSYKASDNFIIKVTNKELQDQLQRNIDFPNEQLPRMLFGKIHLGHDNTNRRLAVESSPSWNWNFTLESISDFGSIQCNASPQQIADFSTHYLNRNICFWNMKVIREISPQMLKYGNPEN